MIRFFAMLAVAAIVAAAQTAAAQTSAVPPSPAPPPATATAPVAPYGPPITPDQARAAAAVVETEKVRRGIDSAAIAVVDPAGRMVYFERQDNATFANLEMAVRKAQAAARLRRSTSVDAARLKAGDLILLLVPGAFPADGGQPIIKDGRLIGAVGVAGGAEDGAIAVAGAKAVN